ncbi:MAG: arginine repressor [Oscillospiraceae bacterium]|nr:arginine repressor [Oscillospiraceae bacterium]
MKASRQEAILKILAARDVETQHQLIDALKDSGVYATQATVSRDIKELHLVKELTPRGTYRYAPGVSAEDLNHSVRLKTIFRESVSSVASAQNIVVLKTLPGLAPAACSAIDGMKIKSLVGTIAGDDTAFLAMIDTEAAVSLSEEIQEMLK